MSTVDWPAGRHFTPAGLTVGVKASSSSWSAFFTGQTQSVSHDASRLRFSMTLPPCRAAAAAEREAFLMQLVTRGDWVNLGHIVRPVPLGTMRGTPTVSANAAASATAVSIQSTASATLLAGDVLKANGQLLVVGYGGGTANGSGVFVDLPLAVPLRKALTAGQSVTWDAPTATFQLVGSEYGLDYRAPLLQMGVTLEFLEVFA